MRTYRLHLIRHGLTEANRIGLYCGSTDLPLDDAGRHELGILKAEFEYPEAEWVFSSPLGRAVQTAEILYPGAEIIEIENLREVSFGEFEGRSMEELRDNPDFAKFLTSGEFLPKGAEPPDAFFARSAAAGAAVIDLMMRSGVHSAAVITHGGVIGNILAALAYPKAAPYSWAAEPGCGYTAVADPTLFFREPVIEVVAKIPLKPTEDSPPDDEP